MLSARHSRTVPSLLALTTRVPSGLDDAAHTKPSWHLRIKGSPLPSACHTHTPSSPALTTRNPSGLNDAADTRT